MADQTQVMAENPFGIQQMLAQGGVVAKSTFAVLVIMSFASWYIIFTKLWDQRRSARPQGSREGLLGRRQHRDGVAKLTGKGNIFKVIAEDGSRRRAPRRAPDRAGPAARVDHRVAAALGRRVISNASARRLPFLATVGSTAPFVGLFGTVWGIYHALDRDRHRRPGIDRQGRGPGRRGADHDRHRSGRRGAGGAGLQLAARAATRRSWRRCGSSRPTSQAYSSAAARVEGAGAKVIGGASGSSDGCGRVRA